MKRLKLIIVGLKEIAAIITFKFLCSLLLLLICFALQSAELFLDLSEEIQLVAGLGGRVTFY